MVKAIIHTPTRVIRRITILPIEEINVASDETLIDGLPSDFDIAKINGKFVKLDLDDKTKLESTDQEALDAGVDQVAVANRKRQWIAEFKLALDDALTSTDGVIDSSTGLEGATAGTAVQLLRDFGTKQRILAQKLKAYLSALKRLT